MDDFYKVLNDDPFFDTSSSDSSSSEDDDLTTTIVGIAHLVGVALLVYVVRRWCCRKSDSSGTLEGEELVADIAELQPKKRLFTGYVLLTPPLGLLGVHHFYLDRLLHGMLAFYTFNFCLIGYFLDLFLLPTYVRRFNNERTAPNAPYDNSRYVIFFRLPLVSVSAVAFILLAFVKTPWVLHKTGVVDIDRIAAQTALNPYDILEIPRNANWETANRAYKTLSRKWHPDRCKDDKEACNSKFAEIGKAHDLIKKRKAPVYSVPTWSEWMQDVLKDWQYVFEVVKGSEDEQSAKTKAGKNRR